MQTIESGIESARVVKYRLVGTVQSVGFRYFLKNKAEQHNLSGFAMNEHDGSLIVLLAGDDETLGKMEPLLHEGPPDARVIAITELVPTDDDLPPPKEFDVR